VKAAFRIDGRQIAGGRVYWFDIEPEEEIFEYRPEHAFPKEGDLDGGRTWTFPAASVSAVELTMKPA
jgi:hypothetical protein